MNVSQLKEILLANNPPYAQYIDVLVRNAFADGSILLHAGRMYVATRRQEPRAFIKKGHDGKYWTIYKVLQDGTISSASTRYKKDVQYLVERFVARQNEALRTGVITPERIGAAIDLKRAAFDIRNRDRESTPSEHFLMEEMESLAEDILHGYSSYDDDFYGKYGSEANLFTEKELAYKDKHFRHLIGRYNAIVGGYGRYQDPPFETELKYVHWGKMRDLWDKGFTIARGRFAGGKFPYMGIHGRVEKIMEKEGLVPVPHGIFPIHPSRQELVDAEIVGMR